MIDNKGYKEELERFSEDIGDSDEFASGTYIIIGATGAIGSVLVDMLMLRNDKYKSGNRVIAVGRNADEAYRKFGIYYERDDFKFVKCDIGEKMPDMGDADYIIHAASNTHPIAYSTDPIGTITTNTIGTKNILDYAVAHKVKKFLFLSTVEIYGENKGYVDRYKEHDCGYIDCNTLRAGYPESKRCGEALCQAYMAEYGLNILIPRLCRIYGPTVSKNDSRAITQFIKKTIEGQNIVLKSKGGQLFSYLYVFDAATAIFKILQNGENGCAYNVADEASEITLKELAEQLADIAGSSVVFEEPDEVERRGYSTAQKAILDNAKLKELGWKARYNISEGLGQTIEILKQVW